MPQVFQVLRCYKCLVFQVQQTKKSNKFQCKVCGEKQSIKRHYGIGTAKDCRLHVQLLNEKRGQIDEIKQSEVCSDEDDDEPINISEVQSKLEPAQGRKSKWSDYVDKEGAAPSGSEIETMYLNDNEVVLEMPKKRKRNHFKCPSQKKSTKNSNSVDSQDENVSYNVIKATHQNVTNDSENTAGFKEKVTHKIDPKIVLKEFIPSTINISKEVIKESVPSEVNSNSKWAQFVEVEQEEKLSEDENLILDNENFGEINILQGHKHIAPEYEPSSDSTHSQDMFALCDDQDLDNVLDI